MRLTLVIPGLLWPRLALLDTIFDLRLPALEFLLGHSQHTRAANRTLSDTWRDTFELDSTELPAAALRMIALGLDPGDRTWLCADPVHLALDRQGASLDDPAQLALNRDEAVALHASLAPVFEAFGELRCDAPDAWHLALKVPPPPLQPDMRDALGRSGDALLPRGDGGRPWRRVLNEAQMVLHAHPVNLAREASGRPTVNSLALWGAGKRPLSVTTTLERMISDDPVLRGLAMCAAITTLPLAGNELPATGDTLIHIDRLLAPTRQQDALVWREALMEIDQRWVAPALAALQAGRLHTLELLGYGEDSLLTLTLQKRDLWKFWRRSGPLTLLAS